MFVFKGVGGIVFFVRYLPLFTNSWFGNWNVIRTQNTSLPGVPAVAVNKMPRILRTESQLRSLRVIKAYHTPCPRDTHTKRSLLVVAFPQEIAKTKRSGFFMSLN